MLHEEQRIEFKRFILNEVRILLANIGEQTVITNSMIEESANGATVGPYAHVRQIHVLLKMYM